MNRLCGSRQFPILQGEERSICDDRPFYHNGIDGCINLGMDRLALHREAVEQDCDRSNLTGLCFLQATHYTSIYLIGNNAAEGENYVKYRKQLHELYSE